MLRGSGAIALATAGGMLANLGVWAPGPGDPVNTGDAVEAIRAIVASGIPYMGVCMGHQLLALAVGARARLWPQNPIHLDDRSEPQPDLALLRPGVYRSALPRPEDVLLLVEVADSTLRYDRDVKVPLYARNGIPEVWLIDLADRRLHRFSDPSPDSYRVQDTLARPGTLPLPGLPGTAMDLSFLFDSP